MTYSKENQPTKTASATSKKLLSSSVMIYYIIAGRKDKKKCDSRSTFPFSSFWWKAGRVENMRQRVETTTNMQETTATPWPGKYFDKNFGSDIYFDTLSDPELRACQSSKTNCFSANFPSKSFISSFEAAQTLIMRVTSQIN